MTSKQTIVSEISSKVGSHHSAWRIGLTNDTASRKAYWRDTNREDVSHWMQWAAESLSDAQDIEAQFINKGMKGGTGGDLSSRQTTYVYIF